MENKDLQSAKNGLYHPNWEPLLRSMSYVGFTLFHWWILQSLECGGSYVLLVPRGTRVTLTLWLDSFDVSSMWRVDYACKYVCYSIDSIDSNTRRWSKSNHSFWSHLVCSCIRVVRERGDLAGNKPLDSTNTFDRTKDDIRLVLDTASRNSAAANVVLRNSWLTATTLQQLHFARIVRRYEQ